MLEFMQKKRLLLPLNSFFGIDFRGAELAKSFGGVIN